MGNSRIDHLWTMNKSKATINMTHLSLSHNFFMSKLAVSLQSASYLSFTSEFSQPVIILALSF
jgi:hypothetical protein